MRVLRRQNQPVSTVTRYRNARIVDAKCDYSGYVYTRGDAILYVGESAPDLPYDREIDLNGLVLMPAFVDLHCHLRDPGYPEKETLETGMKAALKGGYASLCAMANTLPVTATPEAVKANLTRADALKLCRLTQAAAAGENLEDQIPTDWEALSKVTRVLSNDGKTIFSDDFMRKLLLASKKYGFLISTHCQPERKIVARDLELLREVGGNLHIGHISHRETLEMIYAAKAEGLKFTCEVTPHHLFGYDMDYKVNPPLRSDCDARALTEGVLNGTIDCLSTDHAPHTERDKLLGAAGICNIEHAMSIFLEVLLDAGLSLSGFSERASYAPAKLLGLNAGLIAPGYLADLVIVDPDANVVLDRSTMISRSRNTPFSGRKARGRVLMTVVGGEIRYDAR